MFRGDVCKFGKVYHREYLIEKALKTNKTVILWETGFFLALSLSNILTFPSFFCLSFHFYYQIFMLCYLF